MKKMLITGGAGFIGSNFVRHQLNKYNDLCIHNLDLLTYAGNLENLRDVDKSPAYSFTKGNIEDRALIDRLFDEHKFNVVVNFAAETHVDRSIEDPSIFVRTNINGTHNLLEAALQHGVDKFVQISTDEVYGTLGRSGLFSEETPLAPNSPYSASKASADLLARAYYKTYDLPVIVTRCSNNYGPFQFPEKLIPLMIINAIEGRKLPVYGDGLQVRDWLHTADHCCALDLLTHKGSAGEVYNIGGNVEKENLHVVKTVLKELGKSEDLITFVQDRPGHDRRYAIDSSKLQASLNWQPQYTFEQGIRETIDWYLENRIWWKKIISGEYQNYYRKFYGERLDSPI